MVATVWCQYRQYVCVSLHLLTVMIVMLGVALPLTLMFKVQYWVRLARYTWGVPEKYRAQIMEFEKNRQYTQMARGYGGLLLFGYELLTVSGFQGVYCYYDDIANGLVLNADPTVKCFTAGHWPIFFTSCFLLLFVGVIFPVFSFLKARKFFQKGKYEMNIWTMTLAENTTEEFKESQYGFGLISLLVV